MPFGYMIRTQPNAASAPKDGSALISSSFFDRSAFQRPEGEGLRRGSEVIGIFDLVDHLDHLPASDDPDPGACVPRFERFEEPRRSYLKEANPALPSLKS